MLGHVGGSASMFTHAWFYLKLAAADLLTYTQHDDIFGGMPCQYTLTILPRPSFPTDLVHVLRLLRSQRCGNDVRRHLASGFSLAQGRWKGA